VCPRGVSVSIPLLGARRVCGRKQYGGDYRGESLVVAVRLHRPDRRRGRRAGGGRVGHGDGGVGGVGGDEEDAHRWPVFREHDPAFQQVHHQVQLYGTHGLDFLSQNFHPDDGRRPGAQHQRVALRVRYR